MVARCTMRQITHVHPTMIAFHGCARGVSSIHTALERTVTTRLQTYEAPGITVTFDPTRCTHSAVCIRGLPLVFDVRRKRWIHADAASADEVAAQVARCPSGALQSARRSSEADDTGRGGDRAVLP